LHAPITAGLHLSVRAAGVQAYLHSATTGSGYTMFQATVENRGDSCYLVTAASSQFVIGPEGQGMHPLEALLASQAACIAHHVVIWLRDHGQDNSGFSVSASGELSTDKSRIDAVTISARLGRLVPDPEQRAQLHDFVQRCPIYRTLSEACSVTLSLQG
jgi:uncharacterized OsmC-like protein